jgi:hypothetical protein
MKDENLLNITRGWKLAYDRVRVALPVTMRLGDERRKHKDVPEYESSQSLVYRHIRNRGGSLRDRKKLRSMAGR